MGQAHAPLLKQDRMEWMFEQLSLRDVAGRVLTEATCTDRSLSCWCARRGNTFQEVSRSISMGPRDWHEPDASTRCTNCGRRQGEERRTT